MECGINTNFPLDTIIEEVDALVEYEPLFGGLTAVIDAGEIAFMTDEGAVLVSFSGNDALVALAYAVGAGLVHGA